MLYNVNVQFNVLMLQKIGITREEAQVRYNIQDVSFFLERTCIVKVSRIINAPLHSLTSSLKSKRRTRSYFPFDIPSAKTTKFSVSTVMVTLRHLRDNVYEHTKPLQPIASTQLKSQTGIQYSVSRYFLSN